VLSGTGTDGTFGLKAIKEAGGITFAQDPSTAKYDGMPRHAMESGWGDFILPPDGIAQELQNISQHPTSRAHAGGADAGGRREADRPDAHRVRQRPQLLQADHHRPARRAPDGAAQDREAAEYIKFVQTNTDELRLLYKDMLISVTSFFRDRSRSRR
jgi:hypothetical protein